MHLKTLIILPLLTTCLPVNLDSIGQASLRLNKAWGIGVAVVSVAAVATAGAGLYVYGKKVNSKPKQQTLTQDGLK